MTQSLRERLHLIELRTAIEKELKICVIISLLSKIIDYGFVGSSERYDFITIRNLANKPSHKYMNIYLSLLGTWKENLKINVLITGK